LAVPPDVRHKRIATAIALYRNLLDACQSHAAKYHQTIYAK
jgi:hypothetical protein